MQPDTTERTDWTVETSDRRIIGKIYLLKSWKVPEQVHADAKAYRGSPMYLTSKGDWALTFGLAKNMLTNNPEPKEFLVKGISLGLFVPSDWATENGSPNAYSDYRVFRQPGSGAWDAKEVVG